MIAKITAKRQVTFPAKVLDELGVGPGDAIEIRKTSAGYVIVPRRVDTSKLAPLAKVLRKGRGTFDLDELRRARANHALRD
jgi:AbrB family looped-hinge helix DNA binding protein